MREEGREEGKNRLRVCFALCKICIRTQKNSWKTLVWNYTQRRGSILKSNNDLLFARPFKVMVFCTMCAVQAEVMFCQWKVWSRTDNLLCINIKEANMTRGKTSMLQTKRALSENGTKDLDTLSELRRSMPWVCLHTPNPHTWWELWGLVEMFPLAAGAEIIGPRFSQTFWYSHLEPSFDLHSSDQTAPVQTGSPDNVTYFDSFFCMWGIQTHFRLGFFFFFSGPTSVDYDVYGKPAVPCDNQYLSSNSRNSSSRVVRGLNWSVWVSGYVCILYLFRGRRSIL